MIQIIIQVSMGNFQKKTMNFYNWHSYWLGTSNKILKEKPGEKIKTSKH